MPAILGAAPAAAQNQLACLLLAQGVPLLLAGDEVGNSQNGNNNAYCQDNEIGWVDWDRSRQGRRRPDRFRRPPDARCAGAFRRFSCQRWLDGRRADGSYGVLWLTPAADGDDRKRTGIFRKAASSPMCWGRWNKGRRRSLSC